MLRTHVFRFLLASLLILAGVSASAATCPVAQFDAQTAQVSLPCVKLGAQTLRMELGYRPQTPAAGHRWLLQDAGPSQCEAISAQCAVLDNQLNLTLRAFKIAGSGSDALYHAELAYQPAPAGDQGLYFSYRHHAALNQSITLREQAPGPHGHFSHLYVFDGDFSDYTTPKYLRFAENLTPPRPSLPTGREVKLKIFHFNDLHHNLRVTSSARGDTHYMSQIVKKVRDAQGKLGERQDLLLLSAGDDHIGNPFDELLGVKVEEFRTSAAYTAYSAAGVDAVVLGNHEFDRGTAILAQAIAQDAKFPVLSANIFGSRHIKQGQHYHPAVIGVTPSGLRVGIIGLTTKVSTALGTREDPTSDASDMARTAQAAIPYVAPFADVIILLTHVGYNGPINGTVRHVLEIGDVEIAKAAAAVTDKPMILIGGHTHTVLNINGLDTVVDTVPVMQAGAYGSHLGEIDWSILNTSQGLRSQVRAKLHTLKRRDQRPATVNAPDYNPSLYEQESDLDTVYEQTVMQPLYAMLATQLQEVIGVAGDSQALSTDSLIANRYLNQTALHNFMNDAVVARSQHFPVRSDGTREVDIAVFNASGVSNGLAPGRPITFDDWYQVMPFADLIVVATMTGAEIRDMLQSNAQRIVRPEQLAANGGPVKPEDLAGFAYSYGFLHFSKDLKYTIKLNGSAAQAQAIDITIKGQPIESVLNQTFSVAFGDFIALRGGGSENWRGQTREDGRPAKGFDITRLPMQETYLVYRNEIASYIRERGGVSAATGAVIDDRLRIIP